MLAVEVRAHCHWLQANDESHYFSTAVPFMDMEIEGKDKTERYILAAKARARAALSETTPKLTALEKAMWIKLKRGERPCKNSKSA